LCTYFCAIKDDCEFGNKYTTLFEALETIMKDGLSLPVPGSACDLVTCIMGQQHGNPSVVVDCMFPKKCENTKFLKTKSKLIYSNKTIYDSCVYGGMFSIYSHKLSWDLSVSKMTVWSAGSSRISRRVLHPASYSMLVTVVNRRYIM
jgi:hypothetical protein